MAACNVSKLVLVLVVAIIAAVWGIIIRFLLPSVLPAMCNIFQHITVAVVLVGIASPFFALFLNYRQLLGCCITIPHVYFVFVTVNVYVYIYVGVCVCVISLSLGAVE